MATLLGEVELELKKYNISPEQAGILVVVSALGEDAIPSEISRWLLRKPHTISSIIDRMVNKGLINKKSDLKHKNRRKITLTKKGVEIHSMLRENNTINRMMSSLSEEEKQQLKTSLGKLRTIAFKILGEIDRPVFPVYR